jgi:hypothetical protein
LGHIAGNHRLIFTDNSHPPPPILAGMVAGSSLVDPDLVGSESFSRIRIRIWIRKKSFWIGQLRIRNEFEVKLLSKNYKFNNFSTKLLYIKIKIHCHKKIS